MSWGGRALLLLLGLVLLLARCGSYDLPATGPAPPPLVAVATQTREDLAAGGRFQVTVTNGPSDLHVTSVQLLAPGFEVLPPTPRDTRFAPGERFALPTEHGAARCELPDPGRVEVAVGVQQDGVRHEHRYPLQSPGGLLERLHARACAQVALRSQVEVRLLPGLRETGRGLDGEVRLQRLAPGPVRVTEVRGSVLYDVAAPALPVELPAAGRVDVPVRLSAATCDGHRLGEAKKPFVFLLLVRVGTAEPVATELPVDDEHRAALRTHLQRACAG